MLTNATLTRIDTPGPATTGGASTWTNGSTISVRCMLKDTTADQLEGDSKRAIKRSGTMRVLSSTARAAGIALAIDCRVLVAGDGDTAVLYRAKTCSVNSMGGLTFVECGLLQD